MAATGDALTERLRSVREIMSLLYNRMMENMEYGQQERLKDIVEKQEEDWRNDPWVLRFIPDHLKTQEMCIEALETGLWKLEDVPDRFKTKEMCIKAIEVDPWSLKHALDHLKMQEMCDEGVRDDSSSLQFVPDWFVAQGPTDV